MSNLYIYEQGSKVGYKENRLMISNSKHPETSVPIENIDNIVVFGGVQVSTACMQHLLTKGIHLTWLSKNGTYFGRLESTSHINIERQRLQFRTGDDTLFRLEIAKKFIKGKGLNQKTFLLRGNRYLKSQELRDMIKEMTYDIEKISSKQSLASLMGIEGSIARLYYNALNLILDKEFSFEKRTRRPPKDPYNSLISFGYTLLLYEIFTALVTKGLNPYAAFLHSDRHGHPALCSDLMEEWRPILVDSLAVSLINTKRITTENFDYNEENGGVYLNKEGCKLFVEMFEKRLREEVSYITAIPYKMSFRRIIEYQVMQLIKAMEKNDATYYEPVLIR